MKKNELLTQYDIDTNKLMAYGFSLNKGKYFFQKDIMDQLVVIVEISKEIEIYVIDNMSKERYLPFEIIHNNGSYVLKVRKQVENVLDDIIGHCFTKIDMQSLIHTYIQDKYHILYDHPFKKDEITCAYRSKKGKWFALFMTIPYEKIDKDKMGNADIILLKGYPEEIEKLIDHQHYFKAYHMNKTKWMTIVIDKNLNLEQTYKLIDTSYQLVSLSS